MSRPVRRLLPGIGLTGHFLQMFSTCGQPVIGKPLLFSFSRQRLPAGNRFRNHKIVHLRVLTDGENDHPALID